MTVQELVVVLTKADNAYASNKPIITDVKYDALRVRLRKLSPDNAYFARIGGKTKGRKEALPIIVGSLDKLRPGEVAQWMRGIERVAGKQKGWLVLPKFDGQSVTLQYDGVKFAKAWTRGDIVEGRSIGQNVSDAAKMVQGVRPTLTPSTTVNFRKGSTLVRGEVIMHAGIFQKHYLDTPSELGKVYKNARNTAGGLLNTIRPEKVRQDLGRCTFVALQLFRKNSKGVWTRPPSAHMEWVMLSLMGFTTALNPSRYAPGHAKILKMVKNGHEALRSKLPVISSGGINELAYWDHYPTPAEVAKRLSDIRKAVDVKLDGLVVQPIDIAKYVAKGDHLAPRPTFVKSIKLDASEQEYLDGVVRHIEGNISKRGLLKPRLVLKSTLDFDGVEVDYATCNNYAWVRKWGLRPGRPIRLVRSGDVIPRIIAVFDKGKWNKINDVKTVVNKKTGESKTTTIEREGIKDPKIASSLPTKCPDCSTKLRWNETKVDLYCSNEDCPGRGDKKLLSFFRTLGVEDVAKGVIGHLVEAGMTTIPDIMEKATAKRLAKLEGYGEKQAKVVADAIAGSLQGASLHKIMHASGCFQNERHSLGSTKLQLIVTAVGKGMLERAEDIELRKILSRLDGIGPGGLALFLAGLPAWREFWKQISKYHKEDTGPKTLNGLVCAFTGFRDPDMQAFIEKHGGSVRGVSKNCNVLFAASLGSVKAKKADKMGIPIVEQLKAWAWIRSRAGSK
jgi:DNA ligase (NAD+)